MGKQLRFMVLKGQFSIVLPILLILLTSRIPTFIRYYWQRIQNTYYNNFTNSFLYLPLLSSFIGDTCCKQRSTGSFNQFAALYIGVARTYSWILLGIFS